MAETLSMGDMGGESIQDAHLRVGGMAVAAAMRPEVPAYWGDMDGGGPVIPEATVTSSSQTSGGAVTSSSPGGRPTGGQRPR